MFRVFKTTFLIGREGVDRQRSKRQPPGFWYTVLLRIMVVSLIFKSKYSLSEIIPKNDDLVKCQ